MTYTEHYLCIAYVCGRECIRFTGSVGHQTFEQIYVSQPNDCRYAVARDTQGRVLVWDLFDCLVSMPRHNVWPPEPKIYTEQDAALMATLLLYEE